MKMTDTVEDPLEELYRVRRKIAAQYDFDPHKYFLAMVEEQKEMVRQGHVFWGFNAEGKLAPLPPEVILNRPVENFFEKPAGDLAASCV